ncbi:putative cardiolipin synthase, partial [Stegodyphus mimosarum]
MVYLSANIFNNSVSSFNFLLNFRNVTKLKNAFTLQWRYAGSLRFSCNDTEFTPKLDKLLLFSNLSSKSLCYLYSRNERNFSRWTKYSQNGLFAGQNFRKRQRNRSVLLAEKVHSKFVTAKRETRKRVAKKIVEIKENVLTVPNALCALRIISTPVLGYLVLCEFYTASLSVFILAGFTDLIDGYIARNFPNQQTMIGSFLDPAADKLLIATLFVTLTANGLIPVPLTSLIILRDACLMGAGFYIRYVSLPPPKTLSRYFDMSFVTARLSPTAISKANTLIQLSLVAASLAAPVFSYVDHLYLHILWYITGTTTVLSAASYLYYKQSTYKLFTLPEKKNKS